MRIAIILIPLLLLGACAEGPAPSPVEDLGSTTPSNSDLDALVGTWNVAFNEGDQDFEFDRDDIYTISVKNGKYFLTVGEKMHRRDAWKKHKGKKIPLKIVLRRPDASDYLCADGINLAGHEPRSGVAGSERKHVIAFVGKPGANGVLISGDHKGASTCDTLQTHGGRAHAQT